MSKRDSTLSAALARFGWTCGPEFWERYYSDPWVFNLANAVETLTVEAAGASSPELSGQADSEPAGVRGNR